MPEGKNNLFQLSLMSAIVATILIVPAGALVAAGCWLAGVSPYSVLTFGGAVDEVRAVAVWWAIALVPAAIYAAWVTHWRQE